jgi:tRNA modification GTPase
VELVDTAGLREGVDEAERMGIAKSREAMAEADVVLLVVDSTVGVGEEDREVMEGFRVIVVWSKRDLVGEVRGSGFEVREMTEVRTSAVTGEGIGGVAGGDSGGRWVGGVGWWVRRGC